jgi:hypothetical protein
MQQVTALWIRKIFEPLCIRNPSISYEFFSFGRNPVPESLKESRPTALALSEVEGSAVGLGAQIEHAPEGAVHLHP